MTNVYRKKRIFTFFAQGIFNLSSTNLFMEHIEGTGIYNLKIIDKKETQ